MMISKRGIIKNLPPRQRRIRRGGVVPGSVQSLKPLLLFFEGKIRRGLAHAGINSFFLKFAENYDLIVHNRTQKQRK